MQKPNQYTKPFDREEEQHQEYGRPYSKDMRIIMQQWHEAKVFWERIYKVSRRDKKFLQGRQWDAKIEQERNRRGLATSTIPMIRNYYNHALGGALPASIDFEVNNIDTNGGDDKNAEHAINGALRFIDKQSKASIQRHKARKDQFGAGIGWLGVDYVYSDKNMDGEVKIYSPKYFDQVYIHPDFINPDASDCEYSFYINKIPFSVAVAKYGDKIKRIERQEGDICDIDDFDECYRQVSTLDHINTEDWISDRKEVTIAVHHWRRKISRTVYEYEGKEYSKSEWLEILAAVQNSGLDASDIVPIEKEKLEWIVEQRTICGWSVLEEKRFFINTIPWTPVFGYTVEDGQNYTYHSVVHDAINLQESINWLESQSCQKLANAKTSVFIPSGTVSDGFSPIASRGGLDFYTYDQTSDMSGNGAITPIQSQDNGSIELQHMQQRIELLRDMMRISNDIQGQQLVQSGRQLEVSIADRDIYLEEMEINYKSALETHYSKVVKMIFAVHDEGDFIRIIDIDRSEEKVGTANINNPGDADNYSIKVSMSPSGSVRRQQAQDLAFSLMQTGDPSKINLGLMMSIENSDISNKEKVLDEIYKQKLATGDIGGIPKDRLEKIIQEQQETGQLQQQLQGMAAQLAEEKIQELLQQSNVQAQLANAQAVQAKSNNDVLISDTKVQQQLMQAQKDIQEQDFKTQQEIEQTKQEELQALQDFLEVKKEIAEAERQGLEIDKTIIDRLLNITLGSEI